MMSYNGWSNKETWLVNLWLGDSLTMLHEEWGDLTADDIEQQVDVFVEECSGEMNGLIADLLNCALGEIDYHELAEHFVEEDA